MTYDEAMAWIDSLTKFGSVLGLDSIRELAGRLGNPQNKVPIVHVAGTNGKGSIITYLEYILRSAGYKTGKYISPSVVDYWEKIQVGGKMIGLDEVAYFAGRVKKACDEMVKDGYAHPTQFECETAMAFLCFQELKCDIAVMETGMGGRDDATNIIEKPICEVITSVSMDHMGVLGNTLEEIAACKAGIIMPETDVVCYGDNEVVVGIVQQIADKQKARLRVSDFSKIKNVRTEGFTQQFDYGNYKDVTISLAGEHQLKNAATALEAVEILVNAGYKIPRQAVLLGLWGARWPGRFECVCQEPLILLDGAHNIDAAKQLTAAMKKYLSGRKLIFVMGIFRDKEYEKIIRLTNFLASEIITINSDNPRSIPCEELREIVMGIRGGTGEDVLSAASPTEGMKRAVQDAITLGQENTAIVAFGSLSFLGEIRQCVMEMSHTEG